MNAQLIEKFRRGRPLEFSVEEAAFLREALREAMAVTLAVDKSRISDDALVFDDLGLDSIDVFDIFDQLGERFEIQVALEEMPNEMIHGGERATFGEFAEGLLAYFRMPPSPAPGQTH
jgi:acyl carrier protein